MDSSAGGETSNIASLKKCLLIFALIFFILHVYSLVDMLSTKNSLLFLQEIFETLLFGFILYSLAKDDVKILHICVILYFLAIVFSLVLVLVAFGKVADPTKPKGQIIFWLIAIALEALYLYFLYKHLGRLQTRERERGQVRSVPIQGIDKKFHSFLITFILISFFCSKVWKPAFIPHNGPLKHLIYMEIMITIYSRIMLINTIWHQKFSRCLSNQSDDFIRFNSVD